MAVGRPASSPEVAFVDIGELSATIHSLDLAWGYYGNTSDYLAVGESHDFTVLEADPASLAVRLGLKQQTSSPWDSIELGENDEVTCTVRSIKKSRIIVWLEEIEVFGIIMARDWSYRDPEDDPYVSPTPWEDTTGISTRTANRSWQ